MAFPEILQNAIIDGVIKGISDCTILYLERSFANLMTDDSCRALSNDPRLSHALGQLIAYSAERAYRFPTCALRFASPAIILQLMKDEALRERVLNSLKKRAEKEKFEEEEKCCTPTLAPYILFFRTGDIVGPNADPEHAVKLLERQWASTDILTVDNDTTTKPYHHIPLKRFQFKLQLRPDRVTRIPEK